MSLLFPTISLSVKTYSNTKEDVEVIVGKNLAHIGVGRTAESPTQGPISIQVDGGAPAARGVLHFEGVQGHFAWKNPQRIARSLDLGAFAANWPVKCVGAANAYEATAAEDDGIETVKVEIDIESL